MAASEAQLTSEVHAAAQDLEATDPVDLERPWSWRKAMAMATQTVWGSRKIMYCNSNTYGLWFMVDIYNIYNYK